MMQMVMFVLDDPDKLDELLDRWYEQGIVGATVVQSMGLYRRRAQTRKLPQYGNLPRVVESMDEGHLTLFVILPDREMVKRCLTSIEATVGDLGDSHTGVFATWQLTSTKGVALRGESA